MDNKSLVHLIATSFEVKVSSDEFYALYVHTLSYITGGIGSFAYQEILKPYCVDRDFSAKVFRLSLSDNHYFMYRVKMYMYEICTTRGCTGKEANAIGKQHGLLANDARLIFNLLGEQKKMRLRIKSNIKKLGKEALSHKLIKETFTKVHGDVQTYVKNIVYKKCRFISKANNIDLRDIENEIMIHVIKAYWKIVPTTMSDDHVCNYLRRAAHNCAMNFIKTHTSKKRGRLVNTGKDGNTHNVYSLLLISENQLTSISDEGLPVSYDSLGNERDSQMHDFELKHSVATIMSNLKEGSRKHKFITLLMGVEDSEFTDWLREHKYTKQRETNVELQARISPSTFNTLVGRFLKVEQTELKQFLYAMRKRLGAGEQNANRSLSRVA